MPGSLNEVDAQLLVSAAVRAPSMHNTQPWLFHVREDTIDVYADPRRSLPVADPHGRALRIGCGAAVLNLRLAAAYLGRAASVRLTPDRDDPARVATVRLAGLVRPTAADQELYAAIPLRHTNRHPFEGRPLPTVLTAELAAAAHAEGAALTKLDQAATRVVLTLAGQANRARAGNPAYRNELARWIAADDRRPDGIPVTARGPGEANGLLALRDVGGADQDALRPSVGFERHPQLMVLSTRHDSAADWLRAGQALQRVLLTATAHGLATSLLSAPTELPDLRRALRGGCAGDQPQLILRLGDGRPVSPTPRRPIADVTLVDPIRPSVLCPSPTRRPGIHVG
jgi:nitroreductase